MSPLTQCWKRLAGAGAASPRHRLSAAPEMSPLTQCWKRLGAGAASPRHRLSAARCYHPPDHQNLGDGTGERSSEQASERGDDFERRIFGSFDNSPDSNSFYRNIDRLERAQGKSRTGSLMNSGNSLAEDGLGECFDTLSDGMDDKLKKTAKTFEYDDEMNKEDYPLRPDVVNRGGNTYNPKDLHPTKPATPRIYKKQEPKMDTKEVLRKADFRNVRFLQKFLTDSGIIIQRKTTKISAKAQRKVAREIKTARAFGLMPFTTMGLKPFKFGFSMEENDDDYFIGNNSPYRSLAAEPELEADPAETEIVDDV